MRGLLTKDFRLLKMQKKFFLLFFVFALLLTYSGQNIMFLVSYLVFVMSSFGISTVAYDEMNRGYSFLFTLPCTRKQYAIAKHMFASILTGLSGGLALIFMSFYHLMMKETGLKNNLLGGVILILFMWVMQSVLMVCMLKFGAEKGRIAMFLLVGAMFAIGYLVVRAVNVNEDIVIKMMEMVRCVNPILIVGIVLLFCMLLVAGCCMASVYIMNKKEF